jgi:hypothetical protein
VLRVLTVLIQSIHDFMPIEGEGSASVKFLWVQWVRRSKRVEMLFTWWIYGEFFTFFSCSSLLILVQSGRIKDEVKMDCTSLQSTWSWSEVYRWGPIAALLLQRTKKTILLWLGHNLIAIKVREKKRNREIECAPH